MTTIRGEARTKEKVGEKLERKVLDKGEIEKPHISHYKQSLKEERNLLTRSTSKK